MTDIVCLATGNLYKIYKDRNKILPKLLEFSPDGFEINFGYPKYIYSFSPSKVEIAKLRKLKFVSIHAPCLDIKWGNNLESQKALRAIEKIYQKVGAKNVVFHENVGDDLNVTKKYNFSVSIENDDRRKKHNSPQKIVQALKKYPHMGFTFDFAHAMTVSPDDTLEYIKRFKNKIIEIHLAWLGKRIADHRFLHKHDGAKIRKLLKLIKTLNVPLVLECAVANKKQINFIKKEIKYLKNL